MRVLRAGKPDYAERSAPARKIARLSDELADELNRFDAEPLRPAEINRLLTGISCAAGALTRVLDELRASPVLAHAENDLALPARRSVLAELAQAAAAAEDLMVTSAGLSRVLPRVLSTVDYVPPQDRR
ncbi:hypothetical protein Atai01_28340 [Amycolatopsis taiwanensis]|uniref:Uncharacterized protein n=2 Tax=Amycolatopsis taiwanensis TaxID=342230 RepID=A0A9W6VEX2_9PSEU|nr:hypothetical protein Atai01_28340 [Amycolatopsis taiwanensis]